MEVLNTKPYQPQQPTSRFAKSRTLLLAAVFLFSLVSRFNEYYHFREMNSDKARQLQGAYELLHGNGVSFKSYDLTTFHAAVIPIVEWPPGYSFAIAAISAVTGANVYTSSFLLDDVSLVGLWCVLLWLVALLRLSLPAAVLLFLFLGLSKPPLNLIPSSDLLGTVIFLVGCATALWYVAALPSTRRPAIFFLIQTLCLLSLAFLKYSLLPAGFAIGASLLLYTLVNKEKFYKTGLMLLAILIVCLGVVFIYNFHRSGHTNGLYDRYTTQKRSLNLSNLALFDPFVVATFFYMDLFYQRFYIPTVQAVAQVLTLLVLTAVSFSIFKTLKQHRATYFNCLVLSTLISVVGFLAALSVYYPRDVHPTHQWTYVRDFRYFSPVVFLLLLYLLKNLRWSFRTDQLQTVLATFTVTGIAFGLLLSSYYIFSHNEAGSYVNLHGRYMRIRAAVDSLKNDQTYFISLTANAGDDPSGRLRDTKAASIVATTGTRVIMTSEGYYPASAYNVLFSKTKLLPRNKRVVVFYDDNTKVLDSINMNNPHRFGHTRFGEGYLVIN